MPLQQCAVRSIPEDGITLELIIFSAVFRQKERLPVAVRRVMENLRFPLDKTYHGRPVLAFRLKQEAQSGRRAFQVQYPDRLANIPYP